MQRSSSSYLRRACWILKAWMQDPTQVATICPSSPYLTEAISERECIRSATTVVELGPGAGGTTLALLEQMKPDSRLIAIENNAALAEATREIADPRLIVEHGDAADLMQILEHHGYPCVDAVVSGIPFSALPDMAAKKIIRAVYHALCPGGQFLAYQFRDSVLDFALPAFGPPTTQSIPLNLPPLQLYSWKKVENKQRAPQSVCINT
ncbi:class I SAM-dependent methyltransferase [Aporhodopirellula aestuarii]|nr:methyltransferase domain-containing protein [Aporhodopirellula aestuarii]